MRGAHSLRDWAGRWFLVNPSAAVEQVFCLTRGRTFWLVLELFFHILLCFGWNSAKKKGSCYHCAMQDQAGTLAGSGMSYSQSSKRESQFNLKQSLEWNASSLSDTSSPNGVFYWFTFLTGLIKNFTWQNIRCKLPTLLRTIRPFYLFQKYFI